MAGKTELWHYENLPEETITLTEVDEKVKDDYPIVGSVVTKEYEIPSSKDLPENAEILLEKPRWLQYVLVRILDFFDKDKIMKEKGKEFVKERSAYVGKEFLIPVCYPGHFKLVNKPGRLSRYVSVGQIIKDLPRFIRIDQDTEYTPPDQPHTTSTIAAGTKLEVKNIQIIKKERFIKCKSSKSTYTFKEDFPINCTAVDDPEEHTLLNLAGSFVLLPKDVQFEKVWAEEVVLKDDTEASTLLMLFGGPVKILKSFIRRNVFTVWLKCEGTSQQTVGLIPRQIWNNQQVKLKSFQNKTQKEEYIQKHFGENLDSDFALRGLYMLKPVETDVIWLISTTHKMKGEEQVENYEDVEKTLADYENVLRLGEKMFAVDSEKENVEMEEEDEDSEDYENPAPPIPPIPPTNPPPRAAPRRTVSDESKVMLPIARPRKEDILKTIRAKARMGFDKVHEQLLRRYKQKVQGTGTAGRARSESEKTRGSKVVEKKKLSKSLSDDVFENDDEQRAQRFSLAYEINKGRPLPEIPPKSINVTDDDKLEIYEQVTDKEIVASDDSEDEGRSLPENKGDTIARFPDLHKIAKADQSCEDFYSYTVDELVECLKMCKLDKFAVICSTNKLDGAFFRNFELNQLLSEPFLLSSLDFFKVKKIIGEGWRPKTGHAANSMYNV